LVDGVVDRDDVRRFALGALRPESCWQLGGRCGRCAAAAEKCGDAKEGGDGWVKGWHLGSAELQRAEDLFRGRRFGWREVVYAFGAMAKELEPAAVAWRGATDRGVGPVEGADDDFDFVVGRVLPVLESAVEDRSGFGDDARAQGVGGVEGLLAGGGEDFDETGVEACVEAADEGFDFVRRAARLAHGIDQDGEVDVEIVIEAVAAFKRKRHDDLIETNVGAIAEGGRVGSRLRGGRGVDATGEEGEGEGG